MMKPWTMAAILAALSQAGIAAPETYRVDPAHSFARFDIGHMGFSIQSGIFPRIGGTLTLDARQHAGTVDVRIDTATLQTFDTQRDEHLRGSAFFNTARYPAMTFRADKLLFDGDRLSQVAGSLTLLGVTRPVVLQVTHFKTGANPMSGKAEIGANARAEIRRSDFGMTAYVPMIDDQVEIELAIEAEQD